MAFETLRQPARPTLMFHGTSSVHLDAILAGGLATGHAKRTTLKAEAGPDAHLVAFDGAYLSYAPDRAVDYARMAAETFGGDPLVVTVQASPAEGVPDEDEMMWVLKCQFDMEAQERDWQPGFAGLFRDPAFRETYVRMLLREIPDSFEPDLVDREGMRPHLEALLDGVAMLPPGWLSVTGDKGWLVQPWALRMAGTPEGLARYRSALDGLCRCVRGPRATDETCGIDGYKLRMPGGVPLDGPTFVAALGTPDDPTRHLDRLSEVDIASNLFAERFLARPALAPA